MAFTVKKDKWVLYDFSISHKRVLINKLHVHPKGYMESACFSVQNINEYNNDSNKMRVEMLCSVFKVEARGTAATIQ